MTNDIKFDTFLLNTCQILHIGSWNLNVGALVVVLYIYIYIYTYTSVYVYAFSRRFYPKRLTVYSGYTFFVSMCSLGIEPTTFALLTQCSTTEPQEHIYIYIYIYIYMTYKCSVILQLTFNKWSFWTAFWLTIITECLQNVILCLNIKTDRPMDRPGVEGQKGNTRIYLNRYWIIHWRSMGAQSAERIKLCSIWADQSASDLKQYSLSK